MPADESPFSVHASGAVLDEVRQMQHRASRQGRGQECLDAIREIYERATPASAPCGDSDHPLVYVRSVKLLAKPTT